MHSHPALPPVVADNPGQPLQCPDVSSQANVHLLYLVPAVSRTVADVTRSNKVKTWGGERGKGEKQLGKYEMGWYGSAVEHKQHVYTHTYTQVVCTKAPHLRPHTLSALPQ